jgi:transcription elongation factor GreB
MSKAFTKEDDGSNENSENSEVPAIPGGKNYMTPAGAERMRQELKKLRYEERPEVTRVVSWAAGHGDRSENGDYLYGKKRLREIDRRMRFLAKRLEAAEVIDPTTIKASHVQFGATVTIQYEDGIEKTFAIVGIDEADVTQGKISWMSPLARALMKGSEGDVVTFQAPGGQQEIEILSIKYVAVS